MKLKLEDLSNYLLIIIFLLVIIKVLGKGIYTSIIEYMTGQKNTEDFELDKLILHKKSEISSQNYPQESSEKELSLKDIVANSKHSQKEVLLTLLSKIQWGELEIPDEDSPIQLLERLNAVDGFPVLLDYLFKESFLLGNIDQEKEWFRIYKSSLLWINIINQTKSNTLLLKASTVTKHQSLLAIALISGKSVEEVELLSEHELMEITERMHLPLVVKKIKTNKISSNEMTFKEIFKIWHKNAELFKTKS